MRGWITSAAPRRRIATLALAAGLLVCTLPAATGGANPLPARTAAAGGPLVGVDVGLGYGSSVAQATQDMAQAAALHAKVVRVELPWSGLEPDGPGRVAPGALAFTDALMAAAGAHGLKVIATVMSTPCWASSAPRPLLRGCSPRGLTAANAWPPQNPGDYGSFVGFLAARYASRLAAIEVWNEPDQANELYWAGPNKVTRYAALLKSAFLAVKQASPTTPVLAGSLVGSNGRFLQALYNAGIKGNYDGLAVHFYNLPVASVASIRRVQLANGDTKPLWMDEWGWSSCWPRHRIQEEQACVTPAVQARNILDGFRTLARLPYMAALVIYQLQDTAGENFGVLSAGGARKPAYRALSLALSSPFGAVSPVTLRLRRHGGRVTAAGTGPVGDFMLLEVLIGGAPRYRAVFVLDRFNHFSIDLPRQLGTRGLQVHVYRYSSGPASGARRSI
jgi:hypothetical protein